VLLPIGGEDTLAVLSCSTCLPSWEIHHVPIDKPPWSLVNHKGKDRFKCPGVAEGRGLVQRRIGACMGNAFAPAGKRPELRPVTRLSLLVRIPTVRIELEPCEV
jgi:hypothetical protein